MSTTATVRHSKRERVPDKVPADDGDGDGDEVEAEHSDSSENLERPDELDEVPDEDEDAAAAESIDREAEIRKLSALLLLQRNQLATLYTPDKCKVVTVPATSYAQIGFDASTKCIVCQEAILGADSKCHVVTLGETRYAVHAKCFSCRHQVDATAGPCGKHPYVAKTDEKVCWQICPLPLSPLWFTSLSS